MSGERRYRAMPYRDYLRTRRWRKLRNWTLGRWNGMCENCGTARATQVHHRSYDRLGTRDEWRDLVPLCRECHEAEHGIDTARDGNSQRMLAGQRMTPATRHGGATHLRLAGRAFREGGEPSSSRAPRVYSPREAQRSARAAHSGNTGGAIAQ